METILDTQAAVQAAVPMTLVDVLETQFRIFPCDWCPSRKNQLVYTCPETKKRMCLKCMELLMFEDDLPPFEDNLPDVTEDEMFHLLDRMTDAQLA